jgi:hypothetical protein
MINPNHNTVRTTPKRAAEAAPSQERATHINREGEWYTPSEINRDGEWVPSNLHINRSGEWTADRS